MLAIREFIQRHRVIAVTSCLIFVAGFRVGPDRQAFGSNKSTYGCENEQAKGLAIRGVAEPIDAERIKR